MMAQFIHIEAVSKKGRDINRKNKDGTKEKIGSISIDSVIGEAERIAEFSEHVENPQKPNIVYGDTDGFNKLREKLQQWYDETKDARGHKVRQDANSLLSGTASHIFKEENVTHEEHFKNVLRYEKELINALRQEYKSDLFLVVRHDDERFKGVYANIEANEGEYTIEGEIHYHWHFFCLKKPGEKFDLHPGLLAREKYNISRAEKKELSADEIKKRYYDGRKAFRVAMVTYQDRMYELTKAKEYGITRYGERRIRRSRKEQNDLEKVNEKIIQGAQEKANQLVEQVKRQADEDRRRAEEAKKQAEKDRRQAEETRKQSDEDRRKAEEAKRQAEEERRKTDEAKRQADEDRKRAEENKRQADEDRRQAKETRKQAEEERRKTEEAKRQAEEERRKTDEAKKQAEEDRRKTEETRKQADEDRRKTEEAKRQAEEDRRQADVARKQAEEAKRQADEEKRKAEEAKKQADEDRRKAEEDSRRAEAARKQADEDRRKAEEAKKQAEKILEGARNFANMLLEKISKLPGSESIVKWAWTFFKPKKPPVVQGNGRVCDNTQKNTQKIG